MKLIKILSILAVMVCMVMVTAAVASGGEGSEGPWTATKLIWRVINTVALLAFLIYFLKKPLVNFFAERKEQIRRELDEAKLARERAEQLIREYEQKIAGMEKELEKMRTDLAKSSEAESAKVVANADRMAASMVEAAKMTADQEVRKARLTLRNEAVELAVEMAEALIREKINADDRKRIVEDYLAKVGGMK